MESGGESQRRALWVGGLAGILAGLVLLVALIAFLLGPPPAVPPDPEGVLADFPENRALLSVAFNTFIVSFLLFLAFFAALYWSLREPSRFFARIGLGSGILSIILLIIGIAGTFQAQILFSVLYENAAVADRPIFVAAFATVQSFTGASLASGVYFLGLAFVAFGLAMRASPAYAEGYAWLSAILGIVVIILLFLILGLVAVVLLIVLGLVFGWKVYSLSRSA